MKIDTSKLLLGLVVPSLEKGGGVPSVAGFVAKAALSYGISVKLISLSMDSRDPQSRLLLSPRTWFRGATVRHGEWHDMPMQHVGAEWGDFEFQRYRPRRALADAIAECDLVQVVCGSPAWANAVLGLGKPVALQVATRAKIERRRRDSLEAGLSGMWRKAMTAVTDRLDDRALRRVDAIQVENPWMLDYARRVNGDRSTVDIRYAPPGVDGRRFHPLCTQPNKAGRDYILCVGRLDDPRKNIGLLLDAFSRVQADIRQVDLVTAGATSPPADYWAAVKQLGLQGRVRHISRPETDELVSLYQHATAFALPSDEEGLGVVILEAMACAVPVVATRCGGPDGIISDGKDGFLVPVDDVSALANRLRLLCSDGALNHQMGREARATFEAKYDDHVTAAAFVEMWYQLVQKEKSVS